MRSTLYLGILSLALMVVGCSKSTDKPHAGKKKAPALLSIPDKVTVKLLSTGSGDKQKLRYRFVAPQTHGVAVTIAMSVGVTTKKRSIPVQKMPETQMHLTLEHRAVSPSGALNYTFKLTRAGLVGGGQGQSQSQGQGAMEQRFSKVLGPALQQLVGLSGSGEVTPRGVASDAKLVLPDSIPGAARKAVQSLQEQIQQLATPLPEVAVGVGAQWEVKKPLTHATVRMAQSARYTLTKLQGSKVTFDVVLTQFASSQELKSGNLPRGAKVMLHSLKSTGKGRLEIDLTRPVPRGSLRYETLMDQTVSARDKSQRMQLSLKVHARFSPEASSPR